MFFLILFVNADGLCLYPGDNSGDCAGPVYTGCPGVPAVPLPVPQQGSLSNDRGAGTRGGPGSGLPRHCH